MYLRLIIYRNVKHITAKAQKRGGCNRKISTLYVCVFKYYNLYYKALFL